MNDYRRASSYMGAAGSFFNISKNRLVFTKRLGLSFALRDWCFALHHMLSSFLEQSFHHGKSLHTMKRGQTHVIGFVSFLRDVVRCQTEVKVALMIREGVY